MPDTTAAAAPDTLIIACPADASLNRVPRARLGQNPKCGTCHAPLFLGKTVDLTAANFERHVLEKRSARGDRPLGMEWCGPCRMMSPAFEAAAASLEPRVRMAKLDTEAEPALASRYERPQHSDNDHASKRTRDRSHLGCDANPRPSCNGWNRHLPSNDTCTRRYAGHCVS